MLFKLSLQNIKKSMKDYAIYFFTLILGVALFYIFNSIESQSAMMELSESTKEIINLLMETLSAVSVFIAAILGFLIIYASRFLMKRRSQEFGLYLILGMGKRKVSLILFVETVIIGLISLAVGLVIGIAASQMTSVFVAGMFEVDLNAYHFVFSQEATIKTVLYFAIIYMVVIMFNTININKCKLIDLFYGRRKVETVRLKSPLFCSILFVIAAGMLVYSYDHVTRRFTQIESANEIIRYIVLGCIGTFLVFWSVSGLLFQIISSMKKVYYKDLNSFTFRQMSSRINTNVFSMTIICLMFFVTICVLASALTVRNSLSANIRELAPADISLIKSMDRDASYGYTEQQLASRQMTVLEFYDEQGFDLAAYLREYVTFQIYNDPSCTLGSTLGDKMEAIQNQFLFLKDDTLEDLIRLSDYNRVAALYGNETFSLAQDEYLIVADFKSMVQIRNEALAAGEHIQILGHDLKPKYDACQNGFIEMGAQHINEGIIVVPDDVLEEAQASYDYVIGNYLTKLDDEIVEIERKITKINEDTFDSYIVPVIDTKTEVRENSMGLGALAAFVGLYIGLIFLISATAILSLKELSESADNIQRFQMLRKLGADEKLIRKALFRQIAIYFCMPMLLAVIHSIFGMMFSTNVLRIIGTEELPKSIVMTAVIMLVIYGGYFMITYYSSRNMISE